MRICVQGRQPLTGTYRPSGNVNAALALTAAALLTEEPVTLRQMPRTASPRAMFDGAAGLGATVNWADDDLSIQTAQVNRRVLAREETSASVGILMYLAPLLIRRQHVRLEVDFPLNRIRTHLEALRDLGLDV